MTARTCASCAAWEKLPPSVLGPHATKGRCRKSPPDFSGRWPLTEPGDWCLKFLASAPLPRLARALAAWQAATPAPDCVACAAFDAELAQDDAGD